MCDRRALVKPGNDLKSVGENGVLGTEFAGLYADLAGEFIAVKAEAASVDIKLVSYMDTTYCKLAEETYPYRDSHLWCCSPFFNPTHM